MRADGSVDAFRRIEALRELASLGTLATAAATAPPPERRQLTGAAYHLAAPIVYQRVTRRVELRRGHPDCARSMRRLADGCLDRFHDDVESIVDRLFARATGPIYDLEGWMASNLKGATIDGYRKRRGQRGAPQRPRLPAWLATALGHDRWLTTLALDLLEWVGVTATAGTGTWPLEAWAARRGELTGDWTGSDPATVRTDVNRVVAAMRRQPQWYARCVETPLGRKQAPVAPAAPPGGEHPALSLTEPDAVEDALLRGLAADALTQIGNRVAGGEDPRAVVVAVLSKTFGSDTGRHELDRPPHAAPPYEEQVHALLADPSTVRRIVEAALSVLVDSE